MSSFLTIFFYLNATILFINITSVGKANDYEEEYNPSKILQNNDMNNPYRHIYKGLDRVIRCSINKYCRVLI